MTQMDLIKRELSHHIGKEVILKADKGRKRIITKRGILESVYPSLFVVNINNDEAKGSRTVSYTYSDVLTSTVQITILDDDASLEQKIS
ncbi:MAG: Veg family protein [Tissierellia bacterium]|nr:Veg family protein [Tissierellia bacterium]